MPATSDQLSLICIYYVSCIIVISCSTAISVMTWNVNNNGNRDCRLPNFLKVILFKHIACILRIKLSDLNSIKLVKSSNLEIYDNQPGFPLQSLIQECNNINSEFLNKNLACSSNENLDGAFQSVFSDFIKNVKSHISKIEQLEVLKERKEVMKTEWTDAAIVLDRLLFYIFTFIIITISFVIYLNSPNRFGVE